MNRLSHAVLLCIIWLAGPVASFAVDLDSTFYRKLKKIEKNIPLDLNEDVQAAIRKRMFENRTASEDVLSRTQEFFPLIEKELGQLALPMELKYLPVALSDLNPVNVSEDGGSGLWELQYITARRYGLNVNNYVDERRDVRKSTTVAIRYLYDLNAMYHNWALALLAFVSSPSDVNAAIGRAETNKEFWKIFRNIDDPGKYDFIEFVAAAYLVNYYTDYDLQKKSPSRPVTCKSFDVTKNMDIADLSSRLGMTETELRRLNPLFRGNVIPAGTRISLPENLASRYEAIKDTLPLAQYVSGNVDISRNYYFDDNPNKVNTPVTTSGPTTVKTGSTTTTTNSIEKLYYKVVKGDNLGRIAEKYHVTVSDIKSWNHLKGDLIYSGQKLVIQKKVKITVPVTVSAPVTENSGGNTKDATVNTGNTTTENNTPVLTAPPTQKTTKTSGGWVTYRVRTGDSVWRIATKFNVSEEDIRKNNKLSGNLIHPGQLLKIKKG